MSRITRRAAIVGLLYPILHPAIGRADADGAARKINLSGRQRMLSQRMSMAAFVARVGVEPEAHLDVLAAAFAEFGEAQSGLRDGHAELGLTKESDQAVLAALGRVDALWRDYGAAISAIAARGDVPKQELGVLAEMNLQVLSAANDVVKTLVGVYGGAGETSRGAAKAIDMAGRQRMLSQKMVKEVALMALDYRRSETRKALRATVELFDQSLLDLRYGDPLAGIPAPPAPGAEKLSEVEAIWADSAPILRDIAEGGTADEFDVEAVVLNRDELLRTSNEAVFLYENA